VSVHVRLYDRGDFPWVDAKFISAFMTGTRDGVGVELKWSGHRDLKPMHHGAPLFGVGVGAGAPGGDCCGAW
jgi:hypothetical protein